MRGTGSVGALIDYDGVIARRAVLPKIDFVYRFVNRHRDIPRAAVVSFIKNTLAFPADATAQYFFAGLGLGDGVIADFRAAFAAFEQLPRAGNRIDPGFLRFAQWASENDIQVVVTSTARAEMLAKLEGPGVSVFASRGRSKGDPDFYAEAGRHFGLGAGRSLVIDDVPLALASAKAAEFHTVLMRGPVFTSGDIRGYRRWIDHETASWPGFSRLAKRVLRQA